MSKLRKICLVLVLSLLFAADSLAGPTLSVSSNGSTIAKGATFNFGNINPGEEAEALFKISNTGNATLNLTGVPPAALSGSSAFSVSDRGSTAVGYGHICAVQNGGVKCWGLNNYDQTGGGSKDNFVPGLESGVSYLAAGTFHNCAIQNGGLKCWGSNVNGATGGGTPASYINGMGAGSGVTGVSASYHTCAVQNGGLKCWGASGDPKLLSSNSTTSYASGFPAGSGVTAVSAGLNESCVVQNGGAKCLGPDSSWGTAGAFLTGLQVGSGVTAIAAGDSHTCAVQKGGLKCWGYNGSGQTGGGTATTAYVVGLGEGSGVTEVSAGSSHTCIVQNGGLKCFGANSYGQTRGGVVTDFLSGFAPGSSVTAVDAKSNTTCVTQAGALKCWGSNEQSQIVGNATGNFLEGFGAGSGSTDVSAGGSYTCVAQNGGIKCWGLGIGAANGRYDSYITGYGPGSGVSAVKTSTGYHSCAIQNGGLKCWGSNHNGQVNTIPSPSVPSPVAVPNLDSGVTYVALGGNSTCAVQNGGVKCWGYYGNQPAPSSTSAYLPGLGAGSGVTTVAAGGSHVCALQNGGVKCWGANWNGQSVGGTLDWFIPGMEAGSGVTALSAGGDHTCAIQKGGLKCWGYSYPGQPQSYFEDYLPDFQEGSGVTEVAAGGNHICVIQNGGLKCWGHYDWGQAGINSLSAYVPGAGAGSGVSKVTVGDYHTCLLQNGGVRCWGRNNYMQSAPSGASLISGIGFPSGSVSPGSSTWLKIAFRPIGVQAYSGTLNIPNNDTAVNPYSISLSGGGISCGCRDSSALNYDSSAGADCGVCVYQALGCTDATACNYDPSATVDDGACDWSSCNRYGCTDYYACNYNSGAFWDDASCDYSCKPMGCTDSYACNFNSDAWSDDGSCDYSCHPGCMDGWACNYNPDAYYDDGSCDYSCTGCNNPSACNYDPAATMDNGSCDWYCTGGCPDINACNYNSRASYDDGSCEYTSCQGCMDPDACNYKSTARADDGSCQYTSCSGPAISVSRQATPVPNGSVYNFGALISGAESQAVFRISNSGDAPLNLTGSPAVSIAGSSTFRLADNEVIDAGGYHVCAVQNGGLKCWGNNSSEQTGGGNTSDYVIGFEPGSGVASVSAGSSHTCVIQKGGLKCFGTSYYGEAANGSTLNYVSGMEAESGVTSVSAGTNHTCVVQNGGVKCWGDNSQGQTAGGSLSAYITGLAAGSGVTSVSASNYFTCITQNSGVKCWGAGWSGQTGGGSKDTYLSGLAAGSGVSSLSLGSSHACAVQNGGLKCWGDKYYGQIGVSGTRFFQPGFPAGSGVTAVAAGMYHTCVVQNGGVKCWGSNSAGQVLDGVLGGGYLTGFGEGSGVTAITAGAVHTCALQSGAIVCWGTNQNGQVVSNETPFVPTLEEGSGVTAVESEENYTCALQNGGVKCWGLSNFGQTGGASNGQYINGLDQGSGVTSLSAGERHACAVQNNALKCWGYNGNGQVNGTSNSPVSSVTPLAVPNLNTDITAVSAASIRTCAVQNGGVKCWGVAGAGTGTFLTGLSAGTGVTAVSISDNHACAIQAEALKCWGTNANGQVNGTANTPASVANPTAVPNLSSGVTAVAVGDHHTCAMQNGGLKCWGLNSSNQTLGGSTASYLSGFEPGKGVTGIAAGYSNTCVVQNSGVKCWGDDSSGVGGSSPKYFSRVGQRSGVTAVSTRGYHACAVQNGGVRCWGGYESYGETTGLKPGKYLYGMGAGSSATAVALSENHGCAIQNGGLKCWGPNLDMTAGGKPASYVRDYGPGSAIAVLGLGQSHGCIIQGGAVKCWGRNDYGQLIGSPGNPYVLNTPTTVPSLDSGVTALSVGVYHSCAVQNGGAKCWGSDVKSRSAGGNPANYITGLPAGSQVTGVAAGNEHSCAIQNGALKCWGNNNSGQLNGTINSPAISATPMAVPNLSSGVTAVAVGFYHTCAIQNGGLKCWGDNTNGQAVTNSTSSYLTGMGAGSNVTAVAAGYYYTCVIQNGGMKCWGNNDGAGNSIYANVLSASSNVGALWTGSSYSNKVCAIQAGGVRCWGATSGTVLSTVISSGIGTISSSIPPGESSYFRVSYKPGAASQGSNQATVTIANNDPDDNPFIIRLIGGALYKITGIVSSAGRVLKDVIVTVAGGFGSATTDANGAYSISDIPSGTHALSTSKCGMLPASESVSITTANVIKNIALNPVTANSIVWEGFGPDNLWNTATNWNLGRIPGPSDTVIIGGCTNKNLTVPAGYNTLANIINVLDSYSGTVTGSLNMTGGTLPAGSGNFSSVGSLTVNGILNLISGTFKAPTSLVVNGSITSTGGTFNHNGGTIVLAGGSGTSSVSMGNAELNNVTIRPDACSGGTQERELEVGKIAGTLRVEAPNNCGVTVKSENGTLDVGSVSLTIDSAKPVMLGDSVSPLNLNVSGSFVMDDTNSKLNGDINFIAGGTSNIFLVAAGAIESGSITVNKDPGAKLALASNVAVPGNISVLSGKLEAGAYDLSTRGSWIGVANVFDAGSGTVHMTGGDQDIRGSTTFNGLSKNATQATQMMMQTGSTVVVNGTLNLTGQAGQLLTVRPLSYAPYVNLKPNGATNLSYIKPYYIKNVSGAPLNCPTGCETGINSPNWTGLQASSMSVSSLAVYRLYGKVTYLGNPLPGVLVDAGIEGYEPVYTDLSGDYEFSNVPTGSPYTLTLSKEGYNFFPREVMTGLLTSDKIYNYSTVLERYTISGTVRHSGALKEGVIIDAGELGETQTDVEGRFYFYKVPYGTAYSITAIKGGLTYRAANPEGIVEGPLDLFFTNGTVPTLVPTPTRTPTVTRTPTRTFTPTVTSTSTPTATSSPTPMVTPTATITPTPAITSRPTQTPRPTPTPDLVSTPTPTVAQVIPVRNYLVRVLDANDLPVEGVEIFGTHGVNDLVQRFTDEHGEWLLDMDELSDKNPVLAFSAWERGYRFEPAEITPNLRNCEGRICTVKAIKDGKPSAIVHWSVTGADGRGISGVPVSVPEAIFPCAKLSDSDGYVLFAVQKHQSSCLDTDSDLSNNYYMVAPGQPLGMHCTFATSLLNNFRACTRDGSFWGYYTASCQPAAVTAPETDRLYKIYVRNEKNGGLSGIALHGNNGFESLASRWTDTTGLFSFRASQITGASSQSQFTVVPEGFGYRFAPQSLLVGPDTCPNNTCTFIAWKNGVKQGYVDTAVKESGKSLGGVDLRKEQPGSCSTGYSTDGAGHVLIPVLSYGSCDEKAPVKIVPQMPGCTFGDSATPAFEICPAENGQSRSFTASCGPVSGEYTVSGKVYDLGGFPMGGVPILENGFQITSTDSAGTYVVGYQSSSPAKLSPWHASLLFDPSQLSFIEVDRDFQGIDFEAVAPDADGGRLPPETEPCPVKDMYTVSGRVLDVSGTRLSGATILNNGEPVTITGGDGSYAFDTDAQSDLWITAELGEAFFDPGAISVSKVQCDYSNADFRQTTSRSYLLSGAVKDSGGIPIEGATILLTTGGTEREARTDENGFFVLSAPEGKEFTIRASRSGLTLLPVLRAGVVSQNMAELNFSSEESIAPTPTPTVTPTITPASTITPVPTATPIPPTPVPTKTYTPTLTSTPSATVTRTSTPLPATKTPTASPSPAFTMTPAATASRTSTSTPLVPTNTAIPTATRTATAIPPAATQTPLPTVANTAAPENTPNMAPTQAATLTATRTATRSVTPSAASTTAAPTSSPTVSPGVSTATATPTLSATASAAVTIAPSPTVTRTPSASATASPTPQLSPSVPAQQGSPTAAATPAASKTATIAPTNTSTRTPAVSPSPSRTATRTPTATITATATRSATPTRTATPTPSYKLSGSLKSASGRSFTNSELSVLKAMNLSVVFRCLANCPRSYEIDLKSPFSWSTSVPSGSYLIWLESKGKTVTTSKPTRYRLNITSARSGLNFAVRPRR